MARPDRRLPTSAWLASLTALAALAGATGTAAGCRRNAAPPPPPRVPAEDAAAHTAWATWPMPNPAGAGLPNPQSYDLASPDLVVDEVTGLVWQRKASSQTFLWQAGRDRCAELVLGGHDDWRLPSLIELASIVDFTRQVPALDGTAFPDTTGANFWTSTPLAGPPGEAWYLAFSTGFTYHGHATLLSLPVRCVRGGSGAPAAAAGATSPGHYSFPSPGTVLDRWTRLTWQRAIGRTAASWSDAIAACGALSLDGGGWRLPSVKELQTLLALGRAMPALDPTAFPGAPSNEYWSSTPLTGSPAEAWYVNFWLGVTNTLSRTTTVWSRCVR